jgi:hypothetical protein
MRSQCACYQTNRAEGRPRAECASIARANPMAVAGCVQGRQLGALMVPDSANQVGESWRG